MEVNFEQDIADVASIKAIPTMLDIVCRTTGMRFAAVARVTEDRWIACSVRDDINFGLQPGGELDVQSTLCHEIRQSGKAVVIDHVANDATYCEHHTPRTYGLQSYISMPIHLEDGRFFGTLCAIDPAPHRLNTPETIEMFEMFASVIGFHLSAIARLNASDAVLTDERQTAALREQFIAVLSHDLRNPLSAIKAGASLLRRRMNADDRSIRLVDTIQGSVARMSSLIDNVMDFARGRLGGGISLELVDDGALQPMLRQVVDEIRSHDSDRVIEVNLALTDPVRCDRRRIGQLLSNLLGNALTYGDPTAPIGVSAATVDGWFELSVSNSGSPIPPELIDRIFEPFKRGDLKPSLQGLGLGLYISHEVAVAHGGTLTVASTTEETRFTFRMPTGAA